ncbi:MAG: sigma-54-dependent Fis family transcriptional regulator [Acidobacteria bacterium]|nr:sigma-54-dependent Fis family transcriptional regulator [Acidobacteriota bacterium]MBA3886825.1 sigma-54-dependent Fis family transcriptional regulator [Acidobacteriota bacterium]
MSAGAENTLPAQKADPPEAEVRFHALVQSPLRSGLLRFFCARAPESFELESLMQIFGRMRLDIDNCLRELVGFGLARRLELEDGQIRYGLQPPEDPAIRELLDGFRERRATVSHEDRSPAVQRFREMIGRDEKMLVVFEWIRTAAKSDISVLILGPTGAGKEVVGRMIHELSRRGTNRFQAVNCAALPDALFESELFGYERGAFTGAQERKQGRLELADKGTLFLDEIGDLALVAQAKLLRALEERRFERLGGNQAIEVDFRLISSTNRPLDQHVRDTRFREDLYYRVNAFSIRLPSLRERATDIPLLAQRFLSRYCAANGLPEDGKAFARDAVDRLLHYHWPGNIRELEGTVSRAALSTPGRTIRAADLEFLHAQEAPGHGAGGRLSSLADAERAHVLRVLQAVNWNKKQAAQVLEISRGTLYRKIVEYDLEREQKES